MTRSAVDPDIVLEALRCIRSARGLSGLALLHLDAVTLGLRDAELADREATRAIVLRNVLSSIVVKEIRHLQPEPDTPFPERGALHDLEHGFHAAPEDRKHLAAVYLRYLDPDRTPVSVIARELGLSERTLQRYVLLGCQALADVLHRQEREATKALHRHAHAVPAQRILVDAEPSGPAPDAESTGLRSMQWSGAQDLAAGSPPDGMEQLLAAMRSDSRVVRLTPETLRRIAAHPPRNELELRLGRIAEWSLPRFRLDERFVGLTLLLDLGEDRVSGRWQAQAERYAGMHEVVEATESPVVVVLGPPGAGKSTLLRRYELDRAVEGVRGNTEAVPFFISLGQWRSAVEGHAPPAPASWLAQQWARRYSRLASFEQIVRSGRLVLLLDGLNEIPHASSQDYRQRVVLWKQCIHDLVTWPGNQVVIACRSLDYSAPLSTPALRVPQARLEPLDDQSVQAFLLRYLPAHADATWKRLRGSPQLDVVRNPYILRLLVDEVEATSEVPAGRAALLSGFVRRALQREIQRDNKLFWPNGLIAERDFLRFQQHRRWRHPFELPTRGLLFPRLARLGFGLQAGTEEDETFQVRCSYDEALSLVGDEHSADILRAAEALGVLEEDRDEEMVMFQHQLVQEYFAARHLALLGDASLAAQSWRADEVQPTLEATVAGLEAADPLPPVPASGWEETMQLAIVMASSPVTMLEQVAEHSVIIAGRTAVDPELAGRLPAETKRRIAHALVHRSRDPQADLRARIAAGDVLGQVGDPRFERRGTEHGQCLLPPMVAIAEGSYPMGADEAFEDSETIVRAHMPRHVVQVERFQIACFPLTNAEWRCFVEAGGYDNPDWWQGEDARAWREGVRTARGERDNDRFWRRRLLAKPRLLEELHEEGRVDPARFALWRERINMEDVTFEAHLHAYYPDARYRQPRTWGDARFEGASQPVVGICWYEACAYARWLSHCTGEWFVLPSEAEWEVAVRGRAGRRFAYGDEFDALHGGNTLPTHIRRTTPVGVFPDGDTAEGLSDMTGNVTTWTRSMWGADDDEPSYGYPYDASDGREIFEAPGEIQRVVRGVGWNGYRMHAHAAFRFCDYPSNTNYNLGMRLVKRDGSPAA